MRRSRWAPHRQPAPRRFRGVRWWHAIIALALMEGMICLVAWLAAAVFVH